MVVPGRGTDIYTMGACVGTFEVGRSFVSRFIIEALRASSTYDGTRGRYSICNLSLFEHRMQEYPLNLAFGQEESLAT